MGWFAVALPALMLNYLGQGVLILHDPSAAANPFYLMVPGWAQYPMLFLATAATIIASQAAISGSFSVARQAMQLGFLPRLTIRHPSKVEGQIYVPIINWALCVGVVALTLVFQSADRLGDIYLDARLPLALVTPEELDGLLGSVLTHADGAFNTILELGFASSIRKEWEWRNLRGESTRNLEAFRGWLETDATPDVEEP